MDKHVNAIKYCLMESGEMEAVGDTIVADELRLVVEKTISSRPTALYIIADSALPLQGEFKNLIVELGPKAPEQELARYFRRRDRIPLLEGSYKSAGKVASSVKYFLKKALKKSQQKKLASVCILGIQQEIFDLLLKQIPREMKVKNIPLKTSINSFEPGSTISDDSCSTTYLLRLLRGSHTDDEKSREKLEELRKEFRGNSEQAQLVRALILNAAELNTPVLIIGETGSGKNVVAQCIHKHSSREGNFVSINCGAIAGGVFEAELFGHKKGSFTGAEKDRKGLWRSADKGTLFLDEIGDLPLEHQVKLLDVLERGKVRPVGGEEELGVDLRVVSATNRELDVLLQTGQFREDLYYRLRAILIRTPALREQVDDIAYLAQWLWQGVITEDKQAELSEEIIQELKLYRWPGNVRELKSVLSSLYFYFKKNELTVEHLRIIFKMFGQIRSLPKSQTSASEIDLHRVECLRHLRQTEESVRASQVMLEPINKQKTDFRSIRKSVMATLPHRIHELEALTRRPLLFYTEGTYAAINQLKGKLEYFHGLIKAKRLDQALQFTQDELDHQLDLAFKALFTAVNSLLK